MNENTTSTPDDIQQRRLAFAERLNRKIGVVLPYLLVASVILLAVCLVAYALGEVPLRLVLQFLLAIFLISNLILGNKAQLSKENSERNRRISQQLFICTMLLLACQFWLLAARK